MDGRCFYMFLRGNFKIRRSDGAIVLKKQPERGQKKEFSAENITEKCQER
jgi:hypothetical protein